MNVIVHACTQTSPYPRHHGTSVKSRDWRFELSGSTIDFDVKQHFSGLYAVTVFILCSLVVCGSMLWMKMYVMNWAAQQLHWASQRLQYEGNSTLHSILVMCSAYVPFLVPYRVCAQFAACLITCLQQLCSVILGLQNGPDDSLHLSNETYCAQTSSSRGARHLGNN